MVGARTASAILDWGLDSPLANFCLHLFSVDCQDLLVIFSPSGNQSLGLSLDILSQMGNMFSDACLWQLILTSDYKHFDASFKRCSSFFLLNPQQTTAVMRSEQ